MNIAIYVHVVMLRIAPRVTEITSANSLVTEITKRNRDYYTMA